MNTNNIVNKTRQSKNIDNSLSNYTPESIIKSFINVLELNKINNFQKPVKIKGIYYVNESYYMSAKNYYYDYVADKDTTTTIPLRVPTNIRQHLIDNNLYEFKGYINININDSYIKIYINLLKNELPVLLDKTVDKPDNKSDNTDYSNRTKKDIDVFIKQSLLNNQKPKMVIITGKTSKAPDDISSCIKLSKEYYDITTHKINITSLDEIISTLTRVNDYIYDIIVITRGGGNHDLLIFNDAKLVKLASNLKPILVTAIGHATDNSKLQDISDFDVDTPSLFGKYLEDTYISISNHIKSYDKTNNRTPIVLTLVSIFIIYIIYRYFK
jgi:hypothetical protein